MSDYLIFLRIDSDQTLLTIAIGLRPALLVKIIRGSPAELREFRANRPGQRVWSVRQA